MPALRHYTLVNQNFIYTQRGSDFRYRDPFRRYSRWKSEVVRNRAELWTFFALQNFRGAGPQMLYPNCHGPITFHVKKFREVTSPSPKVIGAYTLNDKSIFECSLSRIVGGTPVPGEMCASKSWSFSIARVKISGGSTLYEPKYGLPKKLILVGQRPPPLELCC